MNWVWLARLPAILRRGSLKTSNLPPSHAARSSAVPSPTSRSSKCARLASAARKTVQNRRRCQRVFSSSVSPEIEAGQVAAHVQLESGRRVDGVMAGVQRAIAEAGLELVQVLAQLEAEVVVVELLSRAGVLGRPDERLAPLLGDAQPAARRMVARADLGAVGKRGRPLGGWPVLDQRHDRLAGDHVVARLRAPEAVDAAQVGVVEAARAGRHLRARRAE